MKGLEEHVGESMRLVLRIGADLPALVRCFTEQPVFLVPIDPCAATAASGGDDRSRMPGFPRVERAHRDVPGWVARGFPERHGEGRRVFAIAIARDQEVLGAFDSP